MCTPVTEVKHFGAKQSLVGVKVTYQCAGIAVKEGKNRGDVHGVNCSLRNDADPVRDLRWADLEELTQHLGGQEPLSFRVWQFQ